MTWRDELSGRLRDLDPRGVGDFLSNLLIRNAGLKLMSVLLAFGLWFFVNAAERDAEAALPVPLELRNIPANLMIVSPRVDFVDLRVSGPRALLGRIDGEELSMVLDLGGVRPGPAVFRVRADALNLPRGVSVVRLTPSELTMEFARVARKTVPVHLAITGKPPGDLRVMDTKVKPELVEIIGPSDEVEQIKVAETEPLDLAEAKPGLIERKLALEVPREYLSFSATLVHAQVRIEEPEGMRVLKGIPVVVRNSAYRTAVEPDTVKITVRGPQSSVESLELANGAVYIDATDREPGRYHLSPAVDLPAGVEVVKQQPDTVQLRVLQEKRRVDGE